MNLSLIITCLMSSVDIIMESSVKLYRTNNNIKYIVIAMILYSLQPLLFNYNMKTSTMGMAETNILWNITSTIMVTIVGVYYFKEKLENHSILGIAFGIISIILLNYTDIVSLISSSSS